MAELKVFEENIRQIKTILNDSTSLSNDEKHILSKVLHVIKANMEMNVFNCVLENIKDVSLLISQIDEKINKYKMAKEQIQQNNSNLLYQAGSKKIDSINSIIKKLDSLRNSIENYDFKSLVFSFGINKTDERYLIDRCAGSIAYGYFEFPEIFGETLVDSENLYSYGKNWKSSNYSYGFSINSGIVDKSFEILANKELISELTNYVDIVEQAKKAENAVIKLENDINDLNYCNSNIDYIKNILHAPKYERRRKSFSDYDNGHFMGLLRQCESRYNQCNRNVISRLFHAKEISALEEKIANYKEQIEKNNVAENELKNLKSNVKSPVIADMILHYYEYGDSPETVISQFINGKEKNLLVVKDKLQSLYEQVNLEKSKLSPQARELIDKDYFSCSMLVDLSRKEKRYDISPILSLLVLKTISDSKNIEITQLNSDFDIDIDQLSQRYEIILKGYFSTVGLDFYKIVDNDVDKLVEGMVNGTLDVNGQPINNEVATNNNTRTMGFSGVWLLGLISGIMSCGMIILGVFLR